MKILLGTKNRGKLNEIKRIYSELNSIQFLTFDELPFDDVVEDGSTFFENARKKASQISKQSNLPVLAEDSGLEVETLHGNPGIHSARFAGERSSDSQNIAKLLGQLESRTDREAQFVCVAVLSMPDGRQWHSEGILKGKIALEPMGTFGFGYDPVFIPDGYSQTMGELDPEIKLKISHRRKALEGLRGFIKKISRE